MSSTKEKEAEYRENLIGTDFISCPKDEQIRVFVMGEITTAEDFPDAEIFISYKVELPAGWNPERPEEFSKTTTLTEEELKELNCLESITHSVHPVVLRKEEGGVSNQFYICFPIDLQLIATEKAAQKEWPKIVFQVLSKDHWDRIYMHGCGFVSIPNQPGFHTVTSETWKPALEPRSKVSEFFLGGLIRPKKLEDIAKTSHTNEWEKEGPINRALFTTESSGSVSFQLNVATQTKKVKLDERANFKAFKFSEQTELKKTELNNIKMDSLPSQFNTGLSMGARHGNNRLI